LPLYIDFIQKSSSSVQLPLTTGPDKISSLAR